MRMVRIESDQNVDVRDSIESSYDIDELVILGEKLGGTTYVDLSIASVQGLWTHSPNCNWNFKPEV